MDNKLYVGNLSFGTSEEDLKTLFSQAGVVTSVQVIKDRDSGRSKGFAFVEMESPNDAQQAITKFHGQMFQERALTVNIARPREDRPAGGGRSGGFGGGGRSGGFGGGGRSGGFGGGDRGRSGGFGGDRGDRGGDRGGRRSW